MNRFSDDVVDWVTKSKILGIRAGSGTHRIIGIWVVVVERRVFVRSWSMKERSWWRTFLEGSAVGSGLRSSLRRQRRKG